MALTKVTGAGAEGLTLSSTSLTIANGLTLTDGDIALASGHGLSFAADSSASGMASELLDDYEEGTFTPVCSRDTSGSAHSYGFQHGNYTKVGRMVNAKISIQITGTSTTGSGPVHITGLPFTNAIAGAAGYANTFVIHYNTALGGTADHKSGHMYFSDARVHFESDATSQDTGEFNTAWENGYISLQVTYYTS
tara:strand:+ start:37 stop:618 length:582 start_codon:yes stop_codon:yes gene_type:complete